MSGSALKHERLTGYIVIGRRGPLMLCHGYADPARHILLYSQTVTIFKTRKAAKRVIAQTVKDDESKADPRTLDDFHIRRVAFASEETP